ncbi:hypothetical protein M885DRAFT_573137 [Pelagophyceae sp. CCMP2097]|nr:hypothetical protein M885DRAFT_573137 [Pelagophyceae sp. CCMP2097]
MSPPGTPDRASAGDAPPSPFVGGPHLLRLGADGQLQMMALFTANEDDDDDDEASRVGAKEDEPLSAMVLFVGDGALQTLREDARARNECNDGMLRMIGGSDDEFENDGEIVFARHEPKFKRHKLDWHAPNVLKLRCPTADVDQITETKAALCQDGSTVTKAGTYTGKTGSRTFTTEFRCSFSRRLGCPAKLRHELPGDEVGITELKIAQSHVHDFGEDTSKGLPTRVKILLFPFIQQTASRCAAHFKAFEKGGIDIVKDFPATDQHKAQVMAYVRRERAKGTDVAFANTLGALRSFVEKHMKTYDELRAKFSGMPDDTPGIHDFFVTEDSVGLPLLINGVVDIRQHFHLTAAQLAYGEDIHSPSALMISEARLAAAVSKTSEFSLIDATTHSMNDNSDAAFAANYDCAVHMVAGLKKKPYADKEAHYKPLLEDVKFISKTSLGGGVAELLVRALIRKWGPLEPELIRVWAAEYTGDTKGNWQYCKGRPGMPNHNNSLDGTIRQLLPAVQLLGQMKDFVEMRSKMGVCFATEVNIEL